MALTTAVGEEMHTLFENMRSQVQSQLDGKIKDPRVRQLFVPTGTCSVGVTEIEHCGERIRIFDKERLLIETVRYKTKLPDDLYHEVIGNYREVRHELYGAKIDDYLQSFPRKDVLYRIIRDEVF